MKVAVVPAQIVVVPAIFTLTGKFGFTVIVNVLDVTPPGGIAQRAFDVIMQVSTSAFDKPVLEYTALLVPTFPPFTFHW